jgi:cytochrome P450
MEVLRIAPPAPTLVERIASNDAEIDGIRIEKDTVIEAAAWHIQVHFQY